MWSMITTVFCLKPNLAALAVETSGQDVLLAAIGDLDVVLLYSVPDRRGELLNQEPRPTNLVLAELSHLPCLPAAGLRHPRPQETPVGDQDWTAQGSPLEAPANDGREVEARRAVLRAPRHS